MTAVTTMMIASPQALSRPIPDPAAPTLALPPSGSQHALQPGQRGSPLEVALSGSYHPVILFSWMIREREVKKSTGKACQGKKKINKFRAKA